MRIETKEQVIPEKRYSVTKYIAFDGEEFITEVDCLAHERRLEIENHPVMKSALIGVPDFPEDKKVNLYYLSSWDDFDFLSVALGLIPGSRSKFESDYRAYGPGWYVYLHDYDDYYDYHKLLNYKARIEELESDLLEYKEEMDKIILQKSEELSS